MKTIFKIAQIVLFLLAGNSVFAQRISYKEITEKRIEYITPRLNLTASESEKFWPIFRDFYEQRELIARKSKLRNKQTDEKSPQTEEEYINAINFMIDNKIDQTTLMKEYMKKYLEVLPAEKVYRLYQLDEEFNKFLLEQLKGQGQGRKK
jgi:2,3-bisphosphoglycerate-independent phosphoglycerate mutase